MFDFIRKHTKWTMALLFLLIVPSFVLVGMNSSRQSNETGGVVATVDGKEITRPEWDRAHLQEVDQLRARMPTLDAKLLDSPEARYTTLERMVQERVVAAAATQLKLNTSDQRLARELHQDPAIAALRGANGVLDMEAYRQLLGNNGMSPEMYESSIRADLSNQQVLGAIAVSGFPSNTASDLALNAFLETREVQVLSFNTKDYAAKLTPTEADLEQFHKANEKFFQAPEQANIQYVMLDMASVTKGIVVNEADLKTFYEQNAQRLSSAEERRASHILLASPKTATAAERKKVKAKAQELLALIQKSPETFADVARKNSEDPGSASKGGDLDFFPRGAMVKPFEDAAFALKKGEISAVVESDFGYHIIKLTEIRAPKQRSFEEIRPELEVDLRKQQAQKKFSEEADAFSNSVYEQSDSLTPVVERLKLTLMTADHITHQPQPGVTGVLANPKFLSALFSPDTIEKKSNTEAIEVGSGLLVSGRIVSYTAAHTQPLAEVKDAVRQRWLAERGAEDARKDGTAKLATWKDAPATAKLPAAVVVSRTQAHQLPAAVVNAALHADSTSLPALTGVDLGTQGYAIVNVTKVIQRDAPIEAAAKQEHQQYGKLWTSAESLAYYNGLKERFKGKILIPKPVAGAANTQEHLLQ
ncbi:peptidylprolyl isomerase [Polaromonas sp.]|nr:peptidylprolyl isomerase [Polaromonas sp.]